MEWIQADLLTTYELFEVTTQGRNDFSEWVTSYYVSYGYDGVMWFDISQLYQANRDRNTFVTNQLPMRTYARFIRLRPQTFVHGVALRWDVTGKKLGLLCFYAHFYHPEIKSLC